MSSRTDNTEVIGLLIAPLSVDGHVDTINRDTYHFKLKYGLPETSSSVHAYHFSEFLDNNYGKKFERQVFLRFPTPENGGPEIISDGAGSKVWDGLYGNAANDEEFPIVIAIKGNKSHVEDALRNLVKELPLLEQGLYIQAVYDLTWKSPEAEQEQIAVAQ